MRTPTIKKFFVRGLVLAATLFIFSGNALAQDGVKAEGKTSYLFNPGTGDTKVSFTRLANYTYSPQTIHVGLALTTKPYNGSGGFKPNFSKSVGTLPARTYSKPLSVSGFGSYPKSGTFHVTVGIGVTNAQGGITLVQFLTGKKITFGRKGKKSARARSLRQLDGILGDLVNMPAHAVELK